jgi:hypothetical protein
VEQQAVPLLRVVDAELWWREPIQAWLDAGEVPADCVSDLKTKKNKLSIYEVADEDAAIRVATALALQRAVAGQKQNQSLRDNAALLFPSQVLDELRCDTDRDAKGTTPDETVNGWHFDIVNLSGSQLTALARALVLASQPKTFFKRELLGKLRVLNDQGSISQPIPERVQQQLADLR